MTKEQVQQEQVQQVWISARDAERYSGLSRTTLWRLSAKKTLKVAHVGRSVRFHLPTLTDFMERATGEAWRSSDDSVKE
jgi:predicted DNA-binding transcriptional regulator AlpA